MRLGKMLVFTGLLITVVVGLSLPALAASPATITVEGQADIWDHLFIFLTNDIVRTVLLIIGIAGVVIEIATVGSFGAFGTIGIIAFVLYFMGSIWAGSLGVEMCIRDSYQATPENIATMHWTDYSNTIILTEHAYSFRPLLVNRQWYQSLSEEDAYLIDTAVDNLLSQQKTLAVERYQSSIDALKQQGISCLLYTSRCV